MNKDTIEEWLEIWAKTLAVAPSPRHKPYRACWPDVMHSLMDAYGWTDAALPRNTPTAQQIDIMNMVEYYWMPMLDAHQIHYKPRLIKTILYMRGLGDSFYEIEGRLHAMRNVPGIRRISYKTANRYHDDAVNYLGEKLAMKNPLQKNISIMSQKCYT
jgi:hypothetical protein